ncbi:MAG: choice-of-anchor J domain-containing protein [Bacteroidetes bacterium]|nr:choice-of-anchor J domain-containing protein [Bacteroidota bacterium]
MTDSRCDPFFEAYFETLPLGQFAAEGWSNQPFKGTRLWQVYEDENSNGKSLKITAYGSGDTESDSWLIGPELDVRILSAPQLSFRTSKLYADKSTLEVYLLFGWTADQLLSDVEKYRLEARIANKGDDADRWIDSGPIDLSNLTQPFRVAFRYQGSGKSTYDGTFELDDLRIVDLGASAKF